MRLLGLNYVYDHHMPSAKCGEKSRPDFRGGLFAAEESDDVILRFCGDRKWIVVSQDYKYHLLDNERDAIKQANVGVFYIWGANAAKWDTFRVLARAFPRLLILARDTPRPFMERTHFSCGPRWQTNASAHRS
jgi:hypothetical protein